MSTSFLENWFVVALTNAGAACVLAIIAFAVSRTVRRPPLVHFLWLLVLLKLVTPPILRIPGTQIEDLHRFAQGLLEPGREALPEVKVGERLELDDLPANAGLALNDPCPPALRSMADEGAEPWSDAVADAQPLAATAPLSITPLSITGQGRTFAVVTISTVWLAVASLILLVTASRILRFNRLLRHARTASPDLAAMAESLSRRFGLRKAPEVVLVNARVSPLVWTLGSPARIVLPSALLQKLSQRQIETLIAHELAHVRRRDHWLRWLELGVVALFWWHPVAWWARRDLRRAEEQCCDAWVQQQFSQDVQEYARALLVTVDFLSAGSLAVPRTASGLGEGKLLRRRFEMILHARLPHRMPTSLFCILVIAGAALLPWAPGAAFGQKAEPGIVPPPLVAPVATPRGNNADVEDRLSRLEEQIGAMLAEIKELRASGAHGRPQIPAGAMAVALSPDGKVLFALGADKSSVTAIDNATGNTLWHAPGVVPLAADPELRTDSKSVIVSDKVTGESVHMDVRTGQIYSISPKEVRVDAPVKPGAVRFPNSAATTGAAVGWESRVPTPAPATEATNKNIEAERESLRAEITELRQLVQQINHHLKEIDADATNLKGNLDPAAAKNAAKK